MEVLLLYFVRYIHDYTKSKPIFDNDPYWK